MLPGSTAAAEANTVRGEPRATEHRTRRLSTIHRFWIVAAASAGFLGTSLVVATAGRLALRPGVQPPTRWFGLLDPVRLDRVSLLPAVMLVGVALLTAAWWWLARLAFDGRLTVRGAVAVAVVWCLPVAVGPPILSLDVYSYIAHGTLLAAGQDPYAVGPAVLGDHPAALATDPFWRGARAPYGPLTLGLLHTVVEAVGAVGGSVLASVIVLRVLAVAGVAVTAIAVARAVPAAWRAWALTVVAAGPIVLLQLAGAVHLEALMMALVALGLLAARRERPVVALVLLTAAASMKWPAAVAAVAVVVWHATSASASANGGRLPWLAVARDSAVVAVTVLMAATVVPDGFGWLGAASTPSAGLTLYAPTTGLADLLAQGSRVLGEPVAFSETLRLTRAAGVVVAAAVFLWLLATIRSRDLYATVGFALLCLALLGPVLYPWYLVWGLVPMAMAADRRRRGVLLAVPVVGAFLALPHCELLFVGYPRVAPWIERQAPLLVASVVLVVAAGVVTRRRHLLQG